MEPHFGISQLYFNFCRPNVISCDKLAAEHVGLQFYVSSCQANLIPCEKVAFRDGLFAQLVGAAPGLNRENKEEIAGKTNARDVRR